MLRSHRSNHSLLLTGNSIFHFEWLIEMKDLGEYMVIQTSSLATSGLNDNAVSSVHQA